MRSHVFVFLCGGYGDKRSATNTRRDEREMCLQKQGSVWVNRREIPLCILEVTFMSDVELLSG